MKKKNYILNENNELKKLPDQKQLLLAQLDQFRQSHPNVLNVDSVSKKKYDVSTAFGFDSENFDYTEDRTGNIVITNYIGDDTDVVIPKTINKKKCYSNRKLCI